MSTIAWCRTAAVLLVTLLAVVIAPARASNVASPGETRIASGVKYVRTADGSVIRVR